MPLPTRLVGVKIVHKAGMRMHDLYEVRVKLVNKWMSDPDDRRTNPIGLYLVPAKTRNEALEIFHSTVSIGATEDFSIEAFMVSGEPVYKVRFA